MSHSQRTSSTTQTLSTHNHTASALPSQSVCNVAYDNIKEAAQRSLRISPACYARSDFMQTFPELQALHEQVREDLPEPQSFCLAVPERMVSELLYAWPNPDSELPKGTVLVFELPPEFEPILSSLVADTVAPFNQDTLDATANDSYVGWYAACSIASGQSHHESVAVWLDAIHFSYVLQTTDYAAEQRWPGRFQPVIMMSGASVSYGGFWMTDALGSGIQAATISAQSYDPEEVYSPDELTQMRQRALIEGPRPWHGAVWHSRLEDGGVLHVVEPPMFHFRGSDRPGLT